LENPIKVFDWDALQILIEGASAGIVDDYVNGLSVKGFESGFNEIFAKVWTLLIGGNRNRLDAQIFDALDRFGGSDSVFAIVDDNLGFVIHISEAHGN
jgi:hypothetical protein